MDQGNSNSNSGNGSGFTNGGTRRSAANSDRHNIQSHSIPIPRHGSPVHGHSIPTHALGPSEECMNVCCRPHHLHYGHGNGALQHYGHPANVFPPGYPIAAPGPSHIIYEQAGQASIPQPAMTVNLAPDAPEDASLVAQNLVDMQQLWEDWHDFNTRDLRGEQASSELKRLSSRTSSIAGTASQASVTRQQMVELLMYAAGVLQRHGRDARYLEVLADKLAAVPSRGGALFQNIQNGARQSVTGGSQTVVSRPSLSAALASKNDAAARSRSSAAAKALAWLERHGGGWLGAAATGAAAVVGAQLLKRSIGKSGFSLGSGSHSRRDTEEQRRERRLQEAGERRRIQCEAANQRAREYLKELRENRANPMWHKDPPLDTCPMPPNNLPWRPTDELW